MAEWFNATELGSVDHGFESCSWHMVTVGLESHLYLKVNRKLFCDCRPQIEDCVVCKGLPGTLPNFKMDLSCVYPLLKVLNCSINNRLTFFRKHYYYHDLPNGFQRTQHPLEPIARDGSLVLHGNSRITIDKVYLEEDPASTLKKGVCYKRAGCPILQVVTSPCFSGSLDVVRKQVKMYLKTLSGLCVDLGICDKKKILKTDVNVSLHDGLRYEIKNISSISAVDRALVLAVPLLEQDTGEHKTFHFKNKLIYSRKKTTYLFSKEWNLPAIALEPVDVVIPTTLYTVFQMNMAIHNSHRYAYCKLLYKCLKRGLLCIDQVNKFLHLSEKQGLKAIQLVESRSKLSPNLKTHINQWLVEHQISKLDYSEKNKVFLDALKRLKKRLVELHIPFSSLIIYEYLDSLYIDL